MSSRRIIIVSNRLPYKVEKNHGTVRLQQSSGGLVSGIRSYLGSMDKTGKDEASMPVWVGAPDISQKQFTSYFNDSTVMKDGEFVLHPVFLQQATKDKYYNGFCNQAIWPLFHYFPSFARFESSEYGHYILANNLFCDAIARVYRPGDVIWIHDYHLMLLPALLRKLFPDAAIGFFLHIPFPSFELFRMIPDRWRKELLNGLLGADLIGFHTHDYVQNFIHSVRQVLGYENTLRMIGASGRNVMADTFPISIDYKKFASAAQDHEIFAERNKIRKNLQDIRMLLSVDRLDYAKGLVTRLEGFEAFLERNPHFREKVSYVMLIVPSRDIISRYKENKKEIEGLVSKINGRFGTISWTPVLYQYRSVDFTRLAGLYLAADVAVITPLRDGMNLVSKEFVASRSDRRGVLILSETAGSAAELGEALIVNPFDKHAISEAISVALAMPPEEQKRRMEVMQRRLQSYDVARWAEDFMKEMEYMREKQKLFRIKEMNEQSAEHVLTGYRQASRRLLLLDYDGTLVPLSKLPQYAVPGDELKKLLLALCHDPANTVVLISGRNREVLDEWFGEIPVSLVAEHGAFIKSGGSWQQTVHSGSGWKENVLSVMEGFAQRCAGAFVERKSFSLAWHYRTADQELGFSRSRELLNLLMETSVHLDFQVIEGHKVIEARERGVDKGTASARWLEKETYDFVLAVGDDRTDEDMFRTVNAHGGITIRVGMTQSLAKYNFSRQAEVLEFLGGLAAAKEENLHAARSDNG